MPTYFGSVWIARLLVERGMAALYLIAFAVALQQFRPLLGEHGLLPVPAFLARARFREAPSLFFLGYSDRRFAVLAWTGLALSLLALFGLSEAGPIWLSISTWLVLWALYLSIANVGQTFYAFGWESMLLEAGFFTAFLGPAWLQPSILPLLCLRWMLFRTEVGAGLIKLRHDPCWRDLTCLLYHYETQPLPNPLSRTFHRLPGPLHRVSAFGSHIVQVVVPFLLFAPQPIATLAAVLIIGHQLWLIVSGNYAWLNWLTVVLGFAALSDRWLALILPFHPGTLAPRPLAFNAALDLLIAATVVLSIQPVANLLSPRQVMNRSYNPIHLVNTYGAFGQVGRHRYEIVLEGTDERLPQAQTQWREYGFRAKPGDPLRRPPQIAPWHLRLDWLVWFLPFSVSVTPHGIQVWNHPLWFLRFAGRLLSGDRSTLRLMGKNPFPDHPPAHLRAVLYEYRFTDSTQKRATGAEWTRHFLGVYLPPVSLPDLEPILRP